MAVNKNELSVNVMGQPCSFGRTAVVVLTKLGNMRAKFWEASEKLIFSGFYCRLPTESVQPALTDVEQIFKSRYIFNNFLHIFILSYLTLQCWL